jgi:hypothetical protein
MEGIRYDLAHANRDFGKTTSTCFSQNAKSEVRENQAIRVH